MYGISIRLEFTPRLTLLNAAIDDVSRPSGTEAPYELLVCRRSSTISRKRSASCEFKKHQKIDREIYRTPVSPTIDSIASFMLRVALKTKKATHLTRSYTVQTSIKILFYFILRGASFSDIASRT